MVLHRPVELARHLGQVPQKPVVGLPTEVVNDKGIGHTTGTPDTGNIWFYWGVRDVLLIRRLSSNDPVGGWIWPIPITLLAGEIPCAPRHRARLRFVLEPP
jgi:hypothetical protein